MRLESGGSNALFARVLILAAVLLLGLAHVADALAGASRDLIVAPEIRSISTMPQGWTDDEANWFYDVPQGSHLIPYYWFIALEQAGSQAKFRDSDHMRSLGYLPRQPVATRNPNGLPVGFVKDGEYLGLTCAACHTSQINYNGRALLIDGAPTLGDIEQFQRQLVAAIDETLRDNAKFERFARDVLGTSATDVAKNGLRSKLTGVRGFRKAFNERNLPLPGAPPFGPGRIDAFGVIMNEVAETYAGVVGNHAPADAPVSYPFLWDTPQHDKVQWNGAAPNNESPILRPVLGTSHVGALGRNIGEVFGVFAEVDTSREGSLGQFMGYPSSIQKANLIAIEESLRKLWSPQWPSEFPPINQALRAQGEDLFGRHCISCHGTLDRTSPTRTVEAHMCAVGTDQTMARNFATRIATSGNFADRLYSLVELRRFGPVEPVKDLLTHMVQRVILRPVGSMSFRAEDASNLVVQAQPTFEYSVYAEVQIGDKKLVGPFRSLTLTGNEVQEARSRQPLQISRNGLLFRQDMSTLDGESSFVAPETQPIGADRLPGVRQAVSPAGTTWTFTQPAPIQFPYKARPLNGIWATAPYLHNGSVPNLDELLKPPGARIKKFKLGSREFDPEHVGFVIDRGDFEFDTTLPGNSNAGHVPGREFTEQERKALIEYLKSR